MGDQAQSVFVFKPDMMGELGFLQSDLLFVGLGRKEGHFFAHEEPGRVNHGFRPLGQEGHLQARFFIDFAQGGLLIAFALFGVALRKGPMPGQVFDQKVEQAAALAAEDHRSRGAQHFHGRRIDKDASDAQAPEGRIPLRLLEISGQTGYVAPMSLSPPQQSSLRVPQELLKRNTVVYPTGEFIFREGEPGDTMFIVLKGAVEILKRTDNGSQRQLALLKPGDIMGEMALLDDKPRSATAVAKQFTELLSIQEEGFLLLVSKNPQFGLKIMRSLSKKIRDANALISDFSFSLSKWVYSGIETFAKEQGLRVSAGWRMGKTAFEEWATHRLGVTLREIQSVLFQLRKAGVIWVGNNDELLLKTNGQSAPVGLARELLN